MRMLRSRIVQALVSAAVFVLLLATMSGQRASREVTDRPEPGAAVAGRPPGAGGSAPVPRAAAAPGAGHTVTASGPAAEPPPPDISGIVYPAREAPIAASAGAVDPAETVLPESQPPFDPVADPATASAMVREIEDNLARVEGLLARGEVPVEERPTMRAFMAEERNRVAELKGGRR